MKKSSALSIISFSIIFLVACANATPPVTSTVNPSAQPLIETLVVYAKTVDGIAGSATAYSYTPTPTYTPTVTPDLGVVNKQISDSINNQLISNFEANIRVRDVKFGPLGGQEFTYLYIEINCEGNNNTVCPKNQVIIAVVDACKEKKKKLLESIPQSTEMLTITIFDSRVSQLWIVDINWNDVLKYIDGKISSDEFINGIRSTQYK